MNILINDREKGMKQNVRFINLDPDCTSCRLEAENIYSADRLSIKEIPFVSRVEYSDKR